MTWSDTGELAGALLARFPRRDPLTIRLPDLLRWVPELEGFVDTASRPDWRALESLQAAWYAAYCRNLATAPTAS